ncbi:MAG: glycosyltransferase [Arenicellales bacterium]
MKVAIYVQHLLGSGHLVRARLLADALYADGSQVTLLSGGAAPAGGGYDLVQLPIIKTLPGDFSTLLDQHDQPVSKSWKAARAQMLASEMERIAPDVLVVETWPFGRRQLEFEILPMLAQQTRRPKPPMIVCSIRDILQIRKQERRLQTLQQLEHFFSLVMVHGDPHLISLQCSFSEYSGINCPVVYTGYMCGASDADTGGTEGAGEILVSAGGGAAGFELLRVAAEASSLDVRPWHLLVGPGIDDSEYQAFRQRQHSNLKIERNREDFRRLLANCEVSISQYGYNTALELFTAGCPAVVVPYSRDGETEQAMRAEKFAKKGFCLVLDERRLCTHSLLSAIDHAVEMKPVQKKTINLNGASESVRLIKAHLQQFRL